MAAVLIDDGVKHAVLKCAAAERGQLMADHDDFAGWFVVFEKRDEPLVACRAGVNSADVRVGGEEFRQAGADQFRVVAAFK